MRRLFASVVLVNATVILASAHPMVAACYRRMDVVIADCVPNYEFRFRAYNNVTKQWTLHLNLNCFGGHGASTVPGPEPYPSGTDDKPALVTLEACQTGCSSDPLCTGIVTGIHQPAPPPGGIPYNPGEQIPGPDASKPTSEWLKSMLEWRTFVRDPKWYTGKAYEDPQLKWTRTSYIQPQMHPYDRLFFDPSIGKDGSYTVQKYLDDCKKRYGGGRNTPMIL
jgi:hypothetical protein